MSIQYKNGTYSICSSSSSLTYISSLTSCVVKSLRQSVPHLQNDVHDSPEDLQVHEALAHGLCEEHPHAMIFIRAGEHATVTPVTGLTLPFSTNHPYLVTSISGGICWSAAFHRIHCRCALMICDSSAGSVGGNVLIGGILALLLKSLWRIKLAHGDILATIK